MQTGGCAWRCTRAAVSARDPQANVAAQTTATGWQARAAGTRDARVPSFRTPPVKQPPFQREQRECGEREITPERPAGNARERDGRPRGTRTRGTGLRLAQIRLGFAESIHRDPIRATWARALVVALAQRLKKS